MRKVAVGIALGLAVGAALVACGRVVDDPAASITEPSPAASAITKVRASRTAAPRLAAMTSSAGAAPPAPLARAATRRDVRTAAAGRTELSIPELVRRYRSSVVHIATEAAGVDASGRAVPGHGVATGFIIDAQGRIVTNNHVVGNADRIVITLADGRTEDAKLVGRDPQTDLAVIQVMGIDLPPAVLGSADALEVGESVVAIGHALDLPGGPTVTAGVVSALDRTITNVGLQRLTLSGLIQTDASINPGNSGGPLLNRYGEVVGISTAGAGGSQGISFAIAIDRAWPVIEALVTEGEVRRGFLGITPATVTRSVARQVGLPVNEGVFVARIIDGGAAQQAGLLAQDIIVAIGGDKIGDAGDLTHTLAKYKPGASVEVTYLRPATDDEPQKVEVMLGEAPQP